ncbi:MAG: DUF3500 domain-containing protein, partial [Cyclobacteriaceae bacterium]|nr:DUF3500 domain-containing protein [Cyclobacteriaceae bacterium]
MQLKLISSLVACFFPILLFAQSVTSIQEKTLRFIETLEDGQEDELMIEFADSVRTEWTNLPLGLAPRAGLQYGLLSEKSKIAFHQVLSSIL